MRKIAALGLGLALLASMPARSGENESFFTPNRGGVVIIPHMHYGSDIYYVQLAMTGPGFTFSLLGPSVTRVTPQPGDDWATADEIVGDWKVEDEPAVMLSIEADDTFALTVPADPGDSCPAGTETGPYSYNPDTGVFVPVTTSDGNAICGFSHPTTGGEGPFRLKRSGTALELWVYDPTQGPPFPQVTRFIPQ